MEGFVWVGWEAFGFGFDAVVIGVGRESLALRFFDGVVIGVGGCQRGRWCSDNDLGVDKIASVVFTGRIFRGVEGEGNV